MEGIIVPIIVHIANMYNSHTLLLLLFVLLSVRNSYYVCVLYIIYFSDSSTLNRLYCHVFVRFEAIYHHYQGIAHVFLTHTIKGNQLLCNILWFLSV